MAPSFCFPPVDFWSGVSPSQAAKSRPARKLPAAGTSAVIAVAALTGLRAHAEYMSPRCGRWRDSRHEIVRKVKEAIALLAAAGDALDFLPLMPHIMRKYASNQLLIGSRQS